MRIKTHITQKFKRVPDRLFKKKVLIIDLELGIFFVIIKHIVKHIVNKITPESFFHKVFFYY